MKLKKVTRREAQKALVAGNPVYLLPNRMQVFTLGTSVQSENSYVRREI